MWVAQLQQQHLQWQQKLQQQQHLNSNAPPWHRCATWHVNWTSWRIKVFKVGEQQQQLLLPPPVLPFLLLLLLFSYFKNFYSILAWNFVTTLENFWLKIWNLMQGKKEKQRQEQFFISQRIFFLAFSRRCRLSWVPRIFLAAGCIINSAKIAANSWNIYGNFRNQNVYLDWD